MDQNNYWFGILSHNYYVHKADHAILYNTLSGEYIKVSDKTIISLLEKMHRKENLGVIEINADELNQPEIASFVEESTQKNICRIEVKKTDSPKPIQLMPILNLQRDIDKLNKEDGRSLGEDVLHYLSDVTIYLNDECNQQCSGCNQYDKQFFHCYKSLNSDIFSFDLVNQLLEKLQYAPVRRLAITGGNIFDYPEFERLLSYLKAQQIYPILGVHYKNVNKERVAMIQDFPVEVFVTFPINEECMTDFISQSIPANLKIIFEITSERDYARAKSWIEKYEIENFELRPFFNGKNESFFSSNIYLSEEDILSDLSIQRIIFARQKMNTTFFGALHIYPDGDVKANPSKESIGNYKTDNLLKIIEKEMITNTAWRTIRDKEPCSKCLYQFLCPSPSNYEIAFGKDNLCNIIP